MSSIPVEALAELFLHKVPLIDVRAPVEFAVGALPGAINLPIMNDKERAQVGTTYKNQGREVAIELGHSLVAGPVKELRVQAWADQISRNPDSVIYCFRGGLRSQITQRWLSDVGIQRPIIKGGYKLVRNFFIDTIESFSKSHPMQLITGPTGSAKTKILHEVLKHREGVDLEALARHRGSAFGGDTSLQPSQVNFENSLAVELLKFQSSKNALILEDESRLIGRCAIPESFFSRMRESEVLFVDEPFAKRVDNIYDDYVVASAIGKGDASAAKNQFTQYQKSVTQIAAKLGGARTQEILADLSRSIEEFHKDPLALESNKVWIAKLLDYYYDPMYAKSLAKRAPKISFRGKGQEVLEFLCRT